MPHDSTPTLFLAIPGTQDTRELDLNSVRSAVARGEIGLDNWAWSAQRNEWLPLSQLPEFAVPAASALPKPVRVQPKKIEPVKVTAVDPAYSSGRTSHAATYYSKPVEEHHEFPIFKVLFLVLGVVLASLISMNYYLVDQPFRAKMAKTSFSSVTTHAHLGAFVQPGVLLIHILPSNQINADNFADLLMTLTRSAPHQAIAGHDFQTVSLTPAWLGEYVIPVEDWSGFAEMSGYSTDEKKQFVLNHLQRIDGQPLFQDEKNQSEIQRQAHAEQVWKDLVSHFQSS